MSKEEVVGRSVSDIEDYGNIGCGYMGKLVSYPGGKYEEVGDIFLDITSPHCILVVGKRGTGKSYTLGVLAENFAALDRRYRKKISVLLVDTMSVFHSLKTPNTNRQELKQLKEYGLKAQDFEKNVKIFIPKIALDKAKEKGQDLHYDHQLTLPLSDVDTHDWLNLFDLKPTEPAGILLVRAMQEVSKIPNFGYSEISKAIHELGKDPAAKESLLNLFKSIRDLGVFSKKGTSYDTLVRGGQISVLDLSYLGRIGGFDLRNLILAVIGRRMLAERTLYTTIQMQAEANLIDDDYYSNLTDKHPLVYMLLDEAHLFLPSNDTTLATQTLIDWIKLGRHPGLSLIMATQEPSALHESAIRQADIILAHNVTSNDDVEALGKAKQSFMKGDKDIQQIVASMEYRRGLAVLFDDKTQTVELCKIRPRYTLHTGIDASAL